MRITKPKKEYKILGYTVTSFLIFILGIVAGWYIHSLSLNLLNLDYEDKITFNVDLIGIVSLLISSGIAIFVLRRLQRDDEYRNSEKYSLKKYLEEFRDNFIKQINKAIDGCEIQELYDLFKNGWSELEPLLERAKKRNLIDDNSKSAEKIKEKFIELKQLFTETPKSSEDVQDGIRVSGSENGKFVDFSDKHKSEIKNARLDFDTHICELIFSEIMSID